MNEMSRLAADQDEDYRARFTTAEFEAMLAAGAFDDMKVELIDGELERMQLANNLHGMRQARIVFLLAQVYGIDLTRGSVGVDLGGETLVECDAAVLRRPIAEDRRLIAADLSLVVEVAETTIRRDLGLKQRKYAGAGVRHYWVTDGKASVTHVFADPRDGAYATESQVRFGEPLAVPGADATIVID